VAVDVMFDPRRAGNIVKLNFVALFLTVGAVVFGVVSLGAVIAVPALLGRLGLGSPGLRLLVWLRWPVLAATLLLGLALIYRFSRAVPPPWRWVTPGSALAAALWLVGSALFSWFVSAHTSFQSLDGSIAAFAILLSWFLLSAYVVLVGAAVDAELEATPRHP
jgi:membrane protein